MRDTSRIGGSRLWSLVQIQSLRPKRDDKIIIMSDGLYKLVPDEEIARVIDNFYNIGEALQALEMKARKCAKTKSISRDNMTVALIKIL